MKTTVHIPEALLAEARKIAARDHVTLKILIEEGLRRAIADRKKTEPFHLRDASVKGEGMNPEFVNATWDEMRDTIYGDRA